MTSILTGALACISLLTGEPHELVVHEVTQPSLALSSEGQVLYFGVLGDLVALPVEGGEARVLTRGLAYDHSPLPTADGLALEFLSDREGEQAVFQLDLESLTVEPVDLDVGMHERTLRVLEGGARVGIDGRDRQRPLFRIEDTAYFEHYRPPAGECIEWAGIGPGGRLAVLATSGPWDTGQPAGVQVRLIDLETAAVIATLPGQVHTGERDRRTRAAVGDRTAFVPHAGGIVSIDLETGEQELLEWSASLALDLPQPVERQHPPAAGFDTPPRGIDRVHPAPDGSAVVFAMLGDLWLQSLEETSTGGFHPGGRALALTQGPDLDRMPQFGPRGTHVYFARNGVLARIPATGGEVELLSPTVATEYLDAFHLSADGSQLTSPISMIAPGVQTADVGGAWSVRLPGRSSRGSWVSFPTWGGSGGELLFTAVRERGAVPQAFALLDSGGEPRQVTKLARPPKRVVGSSDGAWLAVLRDGRAWLAHRDGEVLDEAAFEAVGPVGAHSLSFTTSSGADSTCLWIAAGTEVCVVECEGLVIERTLRLEVPERSAEVPESIVLEGCHVIDVETGNLLTDQRVSVVGGRIHGIEECTDEYDGSARLVDATGLYLMPGLFDMHVHQVAPVGRAMLAWGVTSVRQLGSVWPWQLAEPELFQRGERLGPRHLSAGEIFEGVPPAWGNAFHLIDSTAEAEAIVERRARDGIFEIKLYPTLERPLQQVICAQARRSGVRVTSHVSSAREAVNALLDGATCLEHWPETLPALHGDLLGLMEAVGAAWCPTLSVRGVGDLKRRTELEQLSESLFLATVPESTVRRWSDRAKVGAMDDDNLQELVLLRARGVVRAWKAGVQVLVGSDSSVSNALAGPSTHWELEWLVRGGLEPFEALQCATVGAARYAGLPDLGVLREGAIADMVLLSENPLLAIEATRSVEGVVLGGRLLWREDLVR